MKKIMILGAGIYQVPLIEKAKEMGLFTIVVSVEGDYPGFAIADRTYYIDTTDYNKIIKIAKEEGIDGICTTGTDVAVVSIGYVCDHMKLKGISEKTASLSTNKLLMKNNFEKGGVRTARFRKVTGQESAREVCDELHLPIVFKTVDSSGSRGIFVLRDTTEIEEAVNYAFSRTKLDYIIAEEFVDGYEIGIDAFVEDGEIKLTAIHGKYLFNNGKTNVPIGHYFPFECSGKLLTDIQKQAAKVINSMEFNNCAINMDAIISNEECYILEAGGRAGATCIPELIHVHYGIDYYANIIKCALDEETDFKCESWIPCAGKLLSSDKDGIIKSMDISNLNRENIIDISLDVEVGSKVRKFMVGPDRIGQLIVKGKDIEKIEKNIRIEIK